MAGRSGWVVAVALSVGFAASGSAAVADQSGSVSTAGASAVRLCTDAAASSAKSGAPSRAGLEACNEAIRNPSLLTRSQRAGTYLDRSVLLMAAGKYDAAIADDAAAIRLQPDLTEAYIDRGASFMAERRFADAVADYSHALALAPKQPAEVYFDRALALEDMGDLKAAYVDYRQAAQLSPGWDRPKTELARFKVAGGAQG